VKDRHGVLSKLTNGENEGSLANKQKEPPNIGGSYYLIKGQNGRDGEIRTRDLTHPKRARYQAAPRPVKEFSV
jgi:hypothetical protein